MSENSQNSGLIQKDIEKILQLPWVYTSYFDLMSPKIKYIFSVIYRVVLVQDLDASFCGLNFVLKNIPIQEAIHCFEQSDVQVSETNVTSFIGFKSFSTL